MVRSQLDLGEHPILGEKQVEKTPRQMNLECFQMREAWNELEFNGPKCKRVEMLDSQVQQNPQTRLAMCKRKGRQCFDNCDLVVTCGTLWVVQPTASPLLPTSSLAGLKMSDSFPASPADLRKLHFQTISSTKYNSNFTVSSAAMLVKQSFHQIYSFSGTHTHTPSIASLSTKSTIYLRS